MNRFYQILFIGILLFITSCSSNYNYDNLDYSTIDIIGPEDSTLTDIINIYKDSIDLKLDNVIGFSKGLYTKDDYSNTKFNSSLGNLIADIIYKQADSVFYKSFGNNIDFVLQNHGGIRSSLLEGEIKLTDAYKILPFENEIVVLEISKEVFDEMVLFLSNEKFPHPISGFSIMDDKALIDREKSLNDKFFLATNDYLLSGGDNMFFLERNSRVFNLGYSLRDAFIDYTINKENLESKVDNRFIRNE
ncbi:MAG: 5'-nucleotidase C-terminal domain-containing protein [Flavobacteriaceae bacterium]|nr:5'-nucleotidase C-terminal domain-containing protein [Flavobacteriaceae bacterium]